MTSPVSPSETIAKALKGEFRRAAVNLVDTLVLERETNGQSKEFMDWAVFMTVRAFEEQLSALALQLEAMQREMAEKDERISALEAGVSDLVEIARQHVPSIPPDGPINTEHQAAYEATGFALVAIRKRARTLIQGEKK